MLAAVLSRPPDKQHTQRGTLHAAPEPAAVFRCPSTKPHGHGRLSHLFFHHPASTYPPASLPSKSSAMRCSSWRLCRLRRDGGSSGSLSELERSSASVVWSLSAPGGVPGSKLELLLLLLLLPVLPLRLPLLLPGMEFKNLMRGSGCRCCCCCCWSAVTGCCCGPPSPPCCCCQPAGGRTSCRALLHRLPRVLKRTSEAAWPPTGCLDTGWGHPVMRRLVHAMWGPCLAPSTALVVQGGPGRPLATLWPCMTHLSNA